MLIAPSKSSLISALLWVYRTPSTPPSNGCMTTCEGHSFPLLPSTGFTSWLHSWVRWRTLSVLSILASASVKLSPISSWMRPGHPWPLFYMALLPLWLLWLLNPPQRPPSLSRHRFPAPHSLTLSSPSTLVAMHDPPQRGALFALSPGPLIDTATGFLLSPPLFHLSIILCLLPSPRPLLAPLAQPRGSGRRIVRCPWSAVPLAGSLASAARSVGSSVPLRRGTGLRSIFAPLAGITECPASVLANPLKLQVGSFLRIVLYPL